MIPSSTYSSMDPVDSTPVNSLVSQSSKRGIEGGELKQVSMEKEKQVIVNNCYINDRKEGWKQLENGEIPPYILEGKAHRNSSEISEIISRRSQHTAWSRKRSKEPGLRQAKHNTGKNRAQEILWGGSGSAEHVTPTNI